MRQALLRVTLVLGLANAIASSFLILMIGLAFLPTYPCLRHQTGRPARCSSGPAAGPDQLTYPKNALKNVHDHSDKGPSINEVIHFLRFFTPPSPLSPIALKLAYRVMSPFGRSPHPPKWVTSFMDGS